MCTAQSVVFGRHTGKLKQASLDDMIHVLTKVLRGVPLQLLQDDRSKLLGVACVAKLMNNGPIKLKELA